jgi:hypothetical protein
MTFPANWQSPITALPGQVQSDVDPLTLLPSRYDLAQLRLDIQRSLMDAGRERSTLIEVTTDGVIWDGHHAVRAAAEKARLITVKVVNVSLNPTATNIIDLPVG